MKRTLWIVTLVAVVATHGSIASADHSWGNYHWAGRTPVSVHFRDSVGPRWDTYLRTAAVEWDASTVVDPKVSVGSTSGRRWCRPARDTMRVCNYRYGRTGWLGLTTIWIGSNGHILRGSIKINETYFGNPAYTAEGRLHVMCHEFGHAFGLGHRQEGQSCLNVNASTNSPDHTLPDAHDFYWLEQIYSHQTSSTATTTSSDGHITIQQSGDYTVLTHRYPAR